LLNIGKSSGNRRLEGEAFGEFYPILPNIHYTKTIQSKKNAYGRGGGACPLPPFA
jgi:hypothetical protein